LRLSGKVKKERPAGAAGLELDWSLLVETLAI
jgi:hypothetical protein